MSLLPFFYEPNYFVRPTRLLDQHFGVSLDPEDLFEPITVPRSILSCPNRYLRPWRSAASQQDSGSVVNYGKDKFNVSLDVQQFKPEEITVKVTGENTITIVGKHEEKQDEHGYISRQFVRRYVLPKNYDISKVESKLSSDGVLSISAPNLENNEVEHREIPVIKTGEPVKKAENKEVNNSK